MIKNIHTRGKYMQVIGGSASTYINNYGGSQGVGNLRFNTSSQNMEVYDGNNWTLLNIPDATVGLTVDAEEALDWVRQQMEEEKRITELAKTHTAVQIALENLNKAKEHLRITTILSKDEETTS